MKSTKSKLRLPRVKVNCKNCDKEMLVNQSRLLLDSYTGLCTHCYARSKAQSIPNQDQILEGESIIHWPETSYVYDFVPSYKQATRVVPVTCGVCKNRHLTQAYGILKLLKKGEFHGFHQECFGKGIHKINVDKKKYTGISVAKRGYIQLDINYLTGKGRELAEKMVNVKPNGNTHILEHRLVMAIHLNRPLTKDEIVHHLDGNKRNNKQKNLRLLKVNRHHPGHGDDFYQSYQECLMSIRLLLILLSRVKSPAL